MITRFLVILATDISETEIIRQVQKLDLLPKIEELGTWNYSAIHLVPLLLKIIIHEKMRSNLSLLKSIIILLGHLKPDGFISEYAFEETAKNTTFTKEEIFEELKEKHYIENNALSPDFKPMDEAFNFNIDPRFQPVKENILNVLLSIPKDISVSRTLISLLEDDGLITLFPTIIHALSEIGHPVAFPVLLRMVHKNQESARVAIVKMGLRDIEELKNLLGQGVKKDMWGNDLIEKVVVSISPILPFFLEALTGDSFTEYEKKLICFLFSEIGIRRKSDIEIFVQILPMLYEEDITNCFITRVLITGGAETVPFVNTLFEKELSEKGSFEPVILQRFLYILGEIGAAAKLAVPVMNKLLEVHESLAHTVSIALQKIKPGTESVVTEEKAPVDKELHRETPTADLPDTQEPGIHDTIDETGELIDKEQKQTKATDPEDYVLY
ncbi:MAG: hypothetical protein JXJ04_24155 [Spirochaetales bacterium]|nr:hypothetical protein [Spirochaetales bacterium]